MTNFKYKITQIDIFKAQNSDTSLEVYTSPFEITFTVEPLNSEQVESTEEAVKVVLKELADYLSVLFGGDKQSDFLFNKIPNEVNNEIKIYIFQKQSSAICRLIDWSGAIRVTSNFNLNSFKEEKQILFKFRFLKRNEDLLIESKYSKEIPTKKDILTKIESTIFFDGSFKENIDSGIN